MSSILQAAIADTLETGRAILKFISRNDVGDTGGHQCGYYLPRSYWHLFTSHPPTRGMNAESSVTVRWADGPETVSKVKWYGKGTRSEYRLTSFGRGFPYLRKENVGSMLVLVIESVVRFRAYVLATDDEIEAFQVAVGVDFAGGAVAAVDSGEALFDEDADACIARRGREFAEALESFPTSAELAAAAHDAIVECDPKVLTASPDERLIRALEVEYGIFRRVEERLADPRIARGFSSTADFLRCAQAVLQRRKSRAGFSFQHHVQALFEEAGAAYEAQPKIDGRPDFVFPSSEAYEDASFPVERLTCLALKTTCKDRWRQVLNEAKRIPRKHLMTVQRGVSTAQLREMKEAGVVLVVPASLQRDYDVEKSGIEMLSVEQFLGGLQPKNRVGGRS